MNQAGILEIKHLWQPVGWVNHPTASNTKFELLYLPVKLLAVVGLEPNRLLIPKPIWIGNLRKLHRKCWVLGEQVLWDLISSPGGSHVIE